MNYLANQFARSKSSKAMLAAAGVALLSACGPSGEAEDSAMDDNAAEEAMTDGAMADDPMTQDAAAETAAAGDAMADDTVADGASAAPAAAASGQGAPVPAVRATTPSAGRQPDSGEDDDPSGRDLTGGGPS